MKMFHRSRLGVRFTANLIIPVVFAALALIPVDLLDRFPSFCIYRNLFGIRCPGCGMTHAFCAVLHGEFRAAWSYNPLVVVAFPFFAGCAIRNIAAVTHVLSLPKAQRLTL